MSRKRRQIEKSQTDNSCKSIQSYSGECDSGVTVCRHGFSKLYLPFIILIKREVNEATLKIDILGGVLLGIMGGEMWEFLEGILPLYQ